MIEVAEETIAKIVTKDIRKAEAFRKLGLDFCCGGKKTVRQAAGESGIPIETIEQALQEVELRCDINPPAFDKWEPGFLADYIYNQHHVYYYENKEEILFFARKVAGRHGNALPALNQLLELVEKLFQELAIHFYKEEKILFPYIKELTSSEKTGIPRQGVFGHLKDPVVMMEIEHEAAGDLLKDIRMLTNDYQTPDWACNSFRLLYYKLHELEKDLHQHIHLENNILFPKALDLYNKSNNAG